MRQSITVLAAIFSTLTLASGLPAAGEVRIIANNSVDTSSISAAEIKGVFLETRTALKNGARVHPVIVKGPAYSEFVERFLGKTVDGLENYYRSLIFSGTGTIPKVFASDADAIAYVSRTKGAIAYVNASAAPIGVRKLEVK
jgi:hypothetical protein